jgi:hypothetical protein
MWCYDKDVTTVQGLQPSILLAVALAWTATVEAQVSEPFQPGGIEPAAIAYAEHGEYHATLLSGSGVEREPITINVPGASYIKVHFSEFSVPPGMVVEVRNPSGSEAYRYDHANRDAITIDRSRGDDGITRFSARISKKHWEPTSPGWSSPAGPTSATTRPAGRTAIPTSTTVPDPLPC